MRSPVAVILTCLLLAGCTAPAPQLPDGVTVAVVQNRSDYASRTLEISVTNGSVDQLTLTRAAFISARFTAPAEWSRGTELRAGGTVNLRVTLPGSVCSPKDDGGPRVALTFATPNGLGGTATVTPTDPLDRLATIAREDCLEQAVAAVAPLRTSDQLEWSRGAHAPAQLDLEAAPTAAGGSLTIESVDRTVLLSVVVDGKPVESIPFDQRVAAPDARVRVGLTFIPARCDPHAVAEDKRGTFFPVHVAVSGADDEQNSGLIYVPVTDSVRVQIYDYIADYCGF